MLSLRMKNLPALFFTALLLLCPRAEALTIASEEFVRSGVEHAKSYTTTALLDYIAKPSGGSEGYYLRLKSDGDTEWSGAITEALAAKQDSLVSGTSIKTINSSSLLGSGNILIDKSFIGLGNADNTSDLDKPVSTATQSALDGKQTSLPASTNGYIVTHSGVLGKWGTPLSTAGLATTANIDAAVSHKLTNTGTSYPYKGVYSDGFYNQNPSSDRWFKIYSGKGVAYGANNVIMLRVFAFRWNNETFQEIYLKLNLTQTASIENLQVLKVITAGADPGVEFVVSGSASAGFYIWVKTPGISLWITTSYLTGDETSATDTILTGAESLASVTSTAPTAAASTVVRTSNIVF
jgi:hypothetical protein